MPLLKISTNVGTTPHPSALLPDLSRRVAALLGKPEAYVMVVLETEQVMSFGGTTEPTLYAELKNVGRFSPPQTEKLSAELCDALEKALQVPKARIYIEFTPAEGHLWGHAGETFG
jgi:phenylpyruvate tautomerase PptA (4-oxalocrotonate tautomerase family)